ncbi:MAG: hypothetical protein CVU90_10060 [Firmicutes bacterium HGW-Firmicutes-15]|nr:MAG: hypothetical protein CVU90_10060 [Firmicutes bacterium HGW-Firmicutes-15]
MKNTAIEKQSALGKERLDPNHYTLALIEEGHRLGLINQTAMDCIQTQLMSLLADLIIRYTKGESTSVKVETAQSLLLSILYSIDVCISSFPNPEDAIALLKAENLKEIYKKGLALVTSCVAYTRNLYQDIMDKKLDIPIQAYHSTLDEALPDFFNNYDEVFHAQDTMASMDYPLLFDDMHVQGIFYIKQYLESLAIETQFCSLFPKEDVAKLLANYGHVYRIDTREALINVFEVLLTNSLFSILASNKAIELDISKLQYELLRDKFKDLDPGLCSSLIREATEALLRDLGVDQAELRDYIRNFKNVLMPRFINALKHDCLENVIILDSNEHSPLDVMFDEGNTMDDESFRAVVDQIIDCAKAADKTAIINSTIHSLGDFIDILEADCLFGDEFQYLFDSLGDMELSILARIVFIEELRIDSAFSLQSVGEEMMEMQWQREYIQFLQNISPDRLKSIDNYIHSSFQTMDSSDFLDF